MIQASIALVLLAAATLPAVAAGPDALTAYRWRSRVLVISAPQASDSYAVEQRGIVAAATSGMHERDLVVVEAMGLGREAVALRQSLALSSNVFQAVLVGKDGEAKLVASKPIPAATLREIIDAMPMRRQEMRRP